MRSNVIRILEEYIFQQYLHAPSKTTTPVQLLRNNLHILEIYYENDIFSQI